MASPRKKKMAKYMIDDLLAIAKKQIITLNPCLDLKAVLQKMAQEYADVQKEILIKLFPQDEMEILAKYKKTYIQQSFDLPHAGCTGQLGILLPESWRWDFSDAIYEENQSKYRNMVEEYISKKSECIVCTSLVTLTDADVKIIKMNEKLLQEKENGSSAN